MVSKRMKENPSNTTETIHIPILKCDTKNNNENDLFSEFACDDDEWMERTYSLAAIKKSSKSEQCINKPSWHQVNETKHQIVPNHEATNIHMQTNTTSTVVPDKINLSNNLLNMYKSNSEVNVTPVSAKATNSAVMGFTAKTRPKIPWRGDNSSFNLCSNSEVINHSQLTNSQINSENTKVISEELRMKIERNKQAALQRLVQHR